MIHVSAGDYKGMRLEAPRHIRPTEGQVRQALFNILAGVIPGARVLDGYAGSGALGIEALSRGAAFAAFVEQDTECILAIRDNLSKLHDLPRSAWRVVQGDMERALRQLSELEKPFDVILFDPPYKTDEAIKALQQVVQYAMIAPTGILVIEHDRRTELPKIAGPIKQLKQHRYGETVLSFYQAA